MSHPCGIGAERTHKCVPNRYHRPNTEPFSLCIIWTPQSLTQPAAPLKAALKEARPGGSDRQNRAQIFAWICRFLPTPPFFVQPLSTFFTRIFFADWWNSHFCQWRFYSQSEYLKKMSSLLHACEDSESAHFPTQQATSLCDARWSLWKLTPLAPQMKECEHVTA